jgi:hypothetical protein
VPRELLLLLLLGLLLLGLLLLLLLLLQELPKIASPLAAPQMLLLHKQAPFSCCLHAHGRTDAGQAGKRGLQEKREAPSSHATHGGPPTACIC